MQLILAYRLKRRTYAIQNPKNGHIYRTFTASLFLPYLASPPQLKGCSHNKAAIFNFITLSKYMRVNFAADDTLIKGTPSKRPLVEKLEGNHEQ